MIGSKKKSAPATTAMSGMDSTTCVLSSGTVFEGKFESKEPVRIDGKVVGEVKCNQKLVMGESGVIEGTLFADDAVIMGRIKGDLTIKGALKLMSTARIDGSIIAQTLMVEEGASYNGTCKVGGTA